MATLTTTELSNLVLDRVVANVTTDAPISSTEMLRGLNDAYADMWEIEGGKSKVVDSAVAWDTSQSGTGTAMGLLTDINELTTLWVIPTASVVSVGSVTTTASTSVAWLSGFSAVEVGMLVSCTTAGKIAAGTTVTAVTSPTSITLSVAAVAGTGLTLTFTKITTAKGLDRVEQARIRWLRGANGLGTYTAPKVFSLTPVATSSNLATYANRVQLDYWPTVTGYYFPIEYIPQFTPLTAIGSEAPDLTDIGSRDMGLLAAARFAQAIGRNELVPGILGDISARNAALLQRKIEALQSGDQDR